MTAAFWTFLTLVGHWRRHRTNLVTLFMGLAIATALWSGVQALNQQARRSYDQAAAVFGSGAATNLVSMQGALMPQDTYIAMRRAGVKVSPILEGSIAVSSKSYRLVGIDPLTLPKTSLLARISTPGAGTDTSNPPKANIGMGPSGITAFLTPPWQTVVSSETLNELSTSDGGLVTTSNGQPLPPLKVQLDVPEHLLIVDIGVAQNVLGLPGRVSRLIVDPAREFTASQSALIAEFGLRLVKPDDEGDLARLTDSFHLNLTAFGLLSFLVGLFIVHASFGLAFEQRLGTIRTMRAVGVSARTLVLAILVEHILLALIAGTVGMIGGYLIAASLLPDVAASLAGLYGAQVPGKLTLELKWWLSGLGMAVLGTLIAAGLSLIKTFQLPILSIAHAFAWREAQERFLLRQGFVAQVGFAVAIAAFMFGRGLVAGFAVIAGVLLGAALLLPILLSGILKLGQLHARGPLAVWFWADSRQQLSGLSLALMALLIALSTNVGVGTMVEGFRQTFTGWLDQRLVAEVYFEASTDAEAHRIGSWLTKRPEVSAILPIWRTETRVNGWPVEVVGAQDHTTYRDHFPIIEMIANGWDRVARGSAVLVSEQLARRLSIIPGSALDIPTASGTWHVDVVGTYPDYGNPKGQLRVDLQALVHYWPEVRKTSMSLRATPREVPGLIEDMRAEFGSGILRIVDQSTLKALSVNIFDKTFAVTAALNVLTLLVACTALFASLLTLSNARLTQIAPVWAVGVTRQRLSELELVKILVLAAATALLAVPLGLVLAWCLVAIVNVQAFGWRLPLHLFPWLYLQMFGLAVLTAFVSALWPIIRLARMEPARLLRTFADER